MPLTFFSHQAVVLPLKIAAPRYMNGTALVLGSMAPDVEHYVRTYPNATVSHTWPGQLTFSLPVTLALFWIVTRIVAVPLVAHLPRGGEFRLEQYALLSEQPSGVGHWLVVAVSGLIGSSSHVMLDRVYGRLFTDVPWGVLWWSAYTSGWLVLAAATLLTLNWIGRRDLVRRWRAARNGRSSFPDAVLPVPTHAASFWGMIATPSLLAAIAAAIFRRPGYFMHQPATWVHIGLAAVSGAFVGLVIASIEWHRRVRRSTSFSGAT